MSDSKNKTNKYIPILSVAAVLLGIISMVYLLVAPVEQSGTPTGNGKVSVTTAMPLDLGTFPIGGGKVSAKFSFKNTGIGPLSLLKGETSCMCTKATIQKNGETVSSTITMPMGAGSAPTRLDITLAPGEEAEIIAVYDPMAHGPTAVGPIKRDVIITTDSKETPEVKFSFFGNVVK